MFRPKPRVLKGDPAQQVTVHPLARPVRRRSGTEFTGIPVGGTADELFTSALQQVGSEDAAEVLARALALERRAQARLREARAAAVRLEADARAATARGEAEAAAARARALADARERGLAEGRLAGYAAGRQDAEALVAAGREEALRLTTAALEERDGLLEEAAGLMVRLAMATAARIVRSELCLAPQAVVGMVGAALRLVRGSRQLEVRAAPADLPFLVARRGAWQDAAAAADVTLTADPTLARGDFAVVSEQGRVDGRVATQIATLIAQVEAALSEAEAAGHWMAAGQFPAAGEGRDPAHALGAGDAGSGGGRAPGSGG